MCAQRNTVKWGKYQDHLITIVTTKTATSGKNRPQDIKPRVELLKEE